MECRLGTRQPGLLIHPWLKAGAYRTAQSAPFTFFTINPAADMWHSYFTSITICGVVMHKRSWRFPEHRAIRMELKAITVIVPQCKVPPTDPTGWYFRVLCVFLKDWICIIFYVWPSTLIRTGSCFSTRFMGKSLLWLLFQNFFVKPQ